jgi:hypothetical protein
VHRTHAGVRSADLIESAPAQDERTEAIAELGKTRHPARIEHLADELTQAGAQHWTGSARSELIETLILCLTGDSIRQDADAEDAICSTLELIGVMTRAGNLVFAFIPDGELAPSDVVAVRRYRAWLPIRYTTVQPTRRG